MVHACPVAHQSLSKSCSSNTSEDDHVAYERNVKSLNKEYQHTPNNHNHIYKLMKLTFKLRREEINNSVLSVTDLKCQYPYFTNKRWVSTYLIR